MSGEINWGPEIAVEGKRPEWLGDDDPMQWRFRASSCWYGTSDNTAKGYSAGEWVGTLGYIRLPADHPHYATETGSTAPSGGEVGPEVVERLREALTRSVTALNDWLATYADDQCDPRHVAEARSRIAEFGTLAYIADVQQQNRAALALLPEPVDADLVEARRIALTGMQGAEYCPDSQFARQVAMIRDRCGDELTIVQVALAAIKRGRSIEKGEAA